MGAKNATRAATALVKCGARWLLSWGTAVALDPTLAPGTMVLPTVILANNGTQNCSDPRLHVEFLRHTLCLATVNTGMLAETTYVLTSESEKQKLRRATGAVAADMESAAVAAVARRAGIGFLTVRAVLDRSDDALPSHVIGALDPNGRVHPARLILSLFHHPGEIAALWRLFRQRRIAQGTLRAVAPTVRSISAGRGPL